MDKAGSSYGAEVSFTKEDTRDVWLGYINESNLNERNNLWEQIIGDDDVMKSAQSKYKTD